MQKLLREYLDDLNKKQKKSRKAAVAALLLVVLVVGSVAGILARHGVAMTGTAKCGLEEHAHGAECYTKTLFCGLSESEGHTHTDACLYPEELVCGLEENEEHAHTDACYARPEGFACGLEEGGGHVHTDACYTEELTCGKEEHIHTDACYIDVEADVEEQTTWDNQYAGTEWKGVWGEDLVTAARAQLGYKESVNNYAVAEDGSHKGYTRYGQFVGDVYADWDAAFVNFCLHYAGLRDSGLFPAATDAAAWQEEFRNAGGANGAYLAEAGYAPAAGDLVFFRREGEETETQMGIVSSCEEAGGVIHVIEGNSQNEVRENVYDANDGRVTGFLKITELETAYKAAGENPGETTESVPAGETENDGNDAVGEDGEIPADVLEELENSPAYEASYEDDMGTIHVAAGEGTVPEGAELSVRKIELVMTTADMDDDEAAEAQEINDQYELTARKLSEESEKNNTTLEGFLAYDICFLVDGVEVEPNGPVKVTMDFREAVKPEGVSENAAVAVNHLKEDEAAEDGIVVEDLTEKTATTITTVEEDATVEKVELVTETFSVFTVSWMFSGEPYGVPMNIVCVDGTGNLLDPSQSFHLERTVEYGIMYDLESTLALGTITKQVTSEGKTEEVIYAPGSMTLCVGESGQINGQWYYDPRGGEKGEVKKVQFSRDGGVTFYSADGKASGTCTKIDLMLGSWFLKVVYNPASLSIEDQIEESGQLVPVYSGTIAEGAKVQYVWEKSVNGGAYEPVERDQYSNGHYNVAEDGTWLNVALDGGALNDERKSVAYTVELLVDGVSKGKSAPRPIPYYNEVRNGGFENPVTANYEQVGVEGVEGWNTTSKDEDRKYYAIEIARVTDYKIDPHYEYPILDFVAAEGDQFAELNAGTVGSLYQDILVERGTLLHYSFAHRARSAGRNINAEDKMYLLIVPTFVAENGIKHQCEHTDHSDGKGGVIDTQAEVDCLIAHRNETNADGEPLYPGIFLRECTSRADGWTTYSGDYMPTYNLNRFFFVSAKSSPTMGNFLDNVHFSQYLPKPVEGKFSFYIDKAIVGIEDFDNLTEEQLKAELGKLNLEFAVEIKDQDGESVDPSKLITTNGSSIPSTLSTADMTWTQNSDKSWVGAAAFDNVTLPNPDDKYTISVTESCTEPAGYTRNTSVKITESKTMSASDVPADSSNAMTGSVTVQKNASRGLYFTNTYTKRPAEPEYSYTWQVVKCSSSDNGLMLPEAKFTLKDSSGTEVATGVSEEDGTVRWTAKDVDSAVDLSGLSGSYTLEETKAPGGYRLSDNPDGNSWSLMFKENGELDTASSSQPNQNNLVSIDGNTDESAKTKDYVILIQNDVVLYELPSTGGIGTTWYLIGGTLLMLAAALILYKNKCGEVLGS